MKHRRAYDMNLKALSRPSPLVSLSSDQHKRIQWEFKKLSVQESLAGVYIHRHILFTQEQKKLTNAAVVIQSTFRGFLARIYIMTIGYGATLIQKTFRGYAARARVRADIFKMLQNGEIVVDGAHEVSLETLTELYHTIRSSPNQGRVFNEVMYSFIITKANRQYAHLQGKLYTAEQQKAAICIQKCFRAYSRTSHTSDDNASSLSTDSPPGSLFHNAQKDDPPGNSLVNE